MIMIGIKKGKKPELGMDVKNLAGKAETLMNKNAITHLQATKKGKKGALLGVHEFSAKKIKKSGTAKLVGLKGHHKFI